MIASSDPAFRVALYEGVGSQRLDDAARLEIMRALLDKGYAVTSVRNGGTVSGAQTGNLLLLGRFSEARPTQLDGGADVTLHFRDIDGAEPPAVVEMVEAVREDVQGPKAGPWKPWFPVIDYNRCTNCMQCLSFCLFDVYGVSADKKIQVQNQNKCKTDCPACSRVCPEVAILFPKYRSGPINGDEIDPEDLRREAMKVDISALLGGDIYQALRDRSARAKSRFSKERDDERALKERMRCLAELQKNLDIPPEVLGSLPSLDEIQAKAAEAQARGQEARQLAAEGPTG